MPSGKGGRELRLHDARHTYCTHQASAGVPLHLVGAMVGHSSTYMTSRYAHVTPEALQAAAEAAGVGFQWVSERPQESDVAES